MNYIKIKIKNETLENIKKSWVWKFFNIFLIMLLIVNQVNDIFLFKVRKGSQRKQVSALKALAEFQSPVDAI